MAGIAGYAGPWAGTEKDNPEILGRMLATLVARGPDEEGRFRLPGVVLGVRRLMVIDQEGGSQPLRDMRTGVTVVYNGEIYNHTDLRNELENCGPPFRSHSDTEVLLRAYLEYGTNCVNRLNGMFAFAIWDPRTHRLFLARDHLGQKPLYYWQEGSELVFGSDLRAVAAHPAVPYAIDLRGLTTFLLQGHICAPLTIQKGVRQLKPGHLLIWEAEGKRQEKNYWTPQFKPDPRLTLDTAVESFNALWPQVVRRHLVSDLPIGLLLSGGINSSLIATEAAQTTPEFNTFSLGFSGDTFDETPHARTISRLCATRHRVFPFQYAFNDLVTLWHNTFDQPFSDPTMFSTLHLARQTRSQVTVALSGEGADVLFAGYPRYRSTLIGRWFVLIPPAIRRLLIRGLEKTAQWQAIPDQQKNMFYNMARHLSLLSSDLEQEYAAQFQTYTPHHLFELLQLPFIPEPNTLPFLEKNGLLTALLHQDLNHWLPDHLLVNIDRASMACSLETRLPFLDREIVDLALTIPAHIHLGVTRSKQVLRRSLATRLPKELTDRPKQVFIFPIDFWLRQHASQVENILEEGLRRHPGLFHEEELRTLWNTHRHKQAQHGEQILNVLLFFVWSMGPP
ncbi:MAG: asparagine synthase (glutamine-hydrolyzing) [Magnetococcus sp. DMHC-6]